MKFDIKLFSNVIKFLTPLPEHVNPFDPTGQELFPSDVIVRHC